MCIITQILCKNKSWYDNIIYDRSFSSLSHRRSFGRWSDGATMRWRWRNNAMIMILHRPRLRGCSGLTMRPNPIRQDEFWWKIMMNLDFMAKKPLKYNPHGKMQTCTLSSQIFIKTLAPNFTPFPKLKMYSFWWIYKISLFIPVFHQRTFKQCKQICDGP